MQVKYGCESRLWNFFQYFVDDIFSNLLTTLFPVFLIFHLQLFHVILVIRVLHYGNMRKLFVLNRQNGLIFLLFRQPTHRSADYFFPSRFFPPLCNAKFLIKPLYTCLFLIPRERESWLFSLLILVATFILPYSVESVCNTHSVRVFKCM